MATSKEGRIRLANKRILAEGDLDAVDDLFAPNYVAHIGGKDHRGPAFVTRFAKQLRTAIPDLRVAEIEILLASRGTIAWQRTLTGTHKADLKGIPATGKRVKWHDMIVTRFEGAKIAEEWALSGLAEQLLLKQPRH